MTGFGICEFTQRRVSGFPAQALSQESRQERRPEHGAPQALVRLQERAAPHGTEEGDPAHQTAHLHPGFRVS